MNTIVQFFKEIGEKAAGVQKSTKIIIAALGVLVILLVVLLFVSKPAKQKFVFFFPEKDSHSVICTETRYLPVYKDQNIAFSSFISELLLGPFSTGYSPLFNLDSRLSQAFISNKSVYVNIITETIEPNQGIAGYETSWELFKKNVCTNYRSIDKIYLYINGVEVYSENPVIDAVIIK